MSHPLFDLSGRVALVSGAAAGMGRATSIAYAEAGADLMLADINEEGMQDTVRDIERRGRRAGTGGMRRLQRRADPDDVHTAG